jgi:restriction system protein
MDPRRFEVLCGLLFENMGYSVEVTRYVADEGVDAFMRNDGVLSLLQCKRVKGSVGQPVLRDLWGSIAHHGAEFGIVVTTGTVSAPARDWISDKPIRIIELLELTELIERYLGKDAVVPESFSVEADDATVVGTLRLCPNCGKALKERTGKYGKFLGCTGYPDCTFSQNTRRR